VTIPSELGEIAGGMLELIGFLKGKHHEHYEMAWIQYSRGFWARESIE